ncbi:Vesicle transport protein isoform 1 [Schistosoma japonicum]|uniref:Vesicle transport protein n=1 Tax=Schistosoma japonicum TaxID=6182 RepID=A0A4Z2CWD9_SCHJA|nr:Vesicle transport protein isoform 1 [Schistosoma japonicum]
MDKLKQVFTRGNDDEQGILSDVENGCSLSWSTRIKAFIICLVVGIVMSLLGSLCLWLPGAGITLFALFYTLGNICSIGSTIFLMGPMNQLKRMFQETRIIAAVIMLVP